MMKILHITLWLFLYTTYSNAQLPQGYPETNREKQNINLGWMFSKMPEADKPIEIDFDDSQWEAVALPHNPDPLSLWLDSVQHKWQQKEFIRDHNWYRKSLHIDLNNDEKAFIEFEGVHSATELYVNGKFVGRFDINGYVPHHFDITDFVKPGKENTIAVLADHSFDPSIAPDPNETDYLKWGGIYRDVYLVKTNKLHVNFNWEDFDAGVHITTPSVKRNNGTVSVKTTVANEYTELVDCRIETMVLDADGYLVTKLKSDSKVKAGQTYTFRQTTEIVDEYRLWSPNDPYLYRAVSVIYMDDIAVDFVENKFGFRSVELVDGQGLLLNGEPFFMVGVNRHQSYPHIGDAVPNSIHYEAALRYKEAGINAIRLSHYPQDNSFIEACNELGILLYEEPSTWIQWQQGEWMDKLEQSLRIMVRNHRNHPSIVIWGAGINHRGPVPQLNNAAKEEDPFRLTASASAPWNGIKNAGVTDIYATMDYRKTDFPEGDFCMVMEHGFTHNGLGQQHHISRYKKRKNNIGSILWVGADYNRLQPKPETYDFITEYGLQTAYRIPRPGYYWYKSELTDAPYVHIADESVYKNRKVHVYSNAKEVALYADGKLIATQKADNDPLRLWNEHPSITFNYNWTGEKLTAKALSFGQVVAKHSRTKVQEAYAIKLALDNSDIALQAGGSDLKMIRAYVVDRNGETVTNADVKVHFEAKGAGSILYDDKHFISQAQSYHGVATVYLKGAEAAGEIKVKATSGKLKSGALTLKTEAFKADELLVKGKAIYDYPNYKIDIQTEDQLEQFGWQMANGGNAEQFNFKFGEASFSVNSESELKWRKGTYAILGDLAFMACDGLFVEKGKLVLTIKDLPKGKYQLKTYHHSFQDLKKLFPYNMKVALKDANGVFEFISDDAALGIQDGKDIGEREPMSVTNFVESDGVNPVTISFETDKKDAHTWLNGLSFKRVK
ncbi:glycoside hydrolase family 2 TIM barrel-domain containing protein [Labilibacter marinus]|uniref:glycoside hydrolase family 2 TIM barrel-domain containing protein n=1 Tax=Labilibacter marinus TaxID=1477105 RepID=UPI0018E91C14|nr:glycoside hydrolase family 2 TIM barrel-domain containing protein [Labilibacter marinus]